MSHAKEHHTSDFLNVFFKKYGKYIMINFGIIDLIDIFSVACLLYYMYQLMKE